MCRVPYARQVHQRPLELIPPCNGWLQVAPNIAERGDGAE